MTAIHMFTISVEYDECEDKDIAAINGLAAEFEEAIGKAGLALDNLEEDDLA